MSSQKFTNIFGDTEVAGYSPDADRDYYKVTDAQTDHDYYQDKICEAIRFLSNNPTTTAWILYGGTVTSDGAGAININAGAALSVNTAGASRIVSWDTQSSVALPAGWNDNRQIWTVARYKQTLTSDSRTHKTAAVSYHYTAKDMYLSGDDWFLDSSPSSTKAILGSFKMNGALYSDQSVTSTRFVLNSSMYTTTAADVSAIVTDLNNMLYSGSDTAAYAKAYRRQKTIDAGGFHGNVIWKDSDEVIIEPVGVDGVAPWVGAVMNNGKYLELATNTSYTVKYDTPANSGHILDGITAKLNNEWQIIWAYENTASTSLLFGYTWMPRTTIATSAPSATLTLTAVNAQDIAKLYNPGADLLIWESSSKFETKYYNTAAGAYTPEGACYVSAADTTTTLTLDGALAVNNFTTTAYAIQLNNFKPLAVDDGQVTDYIGTRGYRDTGIRILTNGAGAIYQFSIKDGIFYFTNGDGSADYTAITGIETVTPQTIWAVYRLTTVPPDKGGAYILYHSSGSTFYTAKYWDTYGQAMLSLIGATAYLDAELLIEHGLLKARFDAAPHNMRNRGYIL